MSDAIRELHDYLAKSPSVIYPEDVLAYLPAIEAENAKLREYITRLEQANIVLSSDNCDLLNDMSDMQFFIAENRKLRELVRNLLRVIPRDVSGVVIGAHGEHPTYYSFDDAVRELGMEVD